MCDNQHNIQKDNILLMKQDIHCQLKRLEIWHSMSARSISFSVKYIELVQYYLSASKLRMLKYGHLLPF